MFGLEIIAANLTGAAVAAIVAGGIRCLAGWLENSLSDGKIDNFELQQLGATMLKYFSYVFLLSFGLPVEQSIVVAFGLDKVQSILKK